MSFLLNQKIWRAIQVVLALLLIIVLNRIATNETGRFIYTEKYTILDTQTGDLYFYHLRTGRYFKDVESYDKWSNADHQRRLNNQNQPTEPKSPSSGYSKIPK